MAPQFSMEHMPQALAILCAGLCVIGALVRMKRNSKVQFAHAMVPPASASTGPGYHLAPIPRGHLGELSKVQEELYELKDAMAQGSIVMAAVEASDLVGALQAVVDRHMQAGNILNYQSTGSTPQTPGEISDLQWALDGMQNALWDVPAPELRVASLVAFIEVLQTFVSKHLPGMTLRDLVIFSTITKRAFVNGHRSSR